MTGSIISPQQVMDRFTARIGSGIREARISERREGKKKNPHYTIWLEIDKELLRPAIEILMEIRFPHLSVIGANDLGDSIRLVYIFSIQYGEVKSEYMVTFAVTLPKTDLTIPTISDLIPGAVFGEREKQEFLGVKVVGIPDSRRLFLPEDFPAGVYPWRKDETGIPPGMVKDLWASRRPANRPAPVVEIKEVSGINAEPAKESGQSPKEDN
ncbi:MAG: Membrane-bound hydrogenase subunit beta [Methanoregulaceae archaeon PtaU1.Bin059]|nr:MAG: Membrane-bound hydrogenase subunit beta [Methanoregulaceae archaeon PtaB.Bin152]OPY43288.1 MAG: Membrane-bound hydrogenase subunit beta [Methanoregulaceae archaeon PtaU1.Bin059]